MSCTLGTDETSEIITKYAVAETLAETRLVP